MRHLNRIYTQRNNERQCCDGQVLRSKHFFTLGDIMFNKSYQNQITEKAKYKARDILLVILTILAIILFGNQISLADCTLKMGYRTNERLPLIRINPDNSGLYLELYKKAAEKINCKLVVIRKPKKRILQDLQTGRIDFYPGFNFTKERAEYTFYIENGLPGGDVGISPLDLPKVTHLSQLKGRKLLTALGGPNFLDGIEGVKETQISEMTLAKAVLLIRLKRYDFHIYNKSTIEYYFKNNKITDVKTHPNCCGGIKPLYLGFSRKTHNFQEERNSNFDPSQKISVENYPTVLAKESIVWKFAQVLQEMKANGETEQISDEIGSVHQTF